jgi:O-antigen ligase
MFFDLGTIVILLFSAFAWGSNEPWSMALIACATIALLASRLIWDLGHGRIMFSSLWSLAPIFLLVVYVGLQLLFTDSRLTGGRSFIYTIESYTTTKYFLLAVSYLCLAMLVAHGFRSRDRIFLLIYGAVGLGVFEAVYGLIQYLGNYAYIWNFAISEGVPIAHGTFINRNHYALLLNLCICCGVGYVYYRSSEILNGSNWSFRRIAGVPGSAQLVWILLWLALMGLALVFSMSRMGIVGMFGCIAAMIIAGKTSARSKRTTFLGVTLVCLILAWAAYIGIDSVLERYESITQSGYFEKDRLPIWRDAWDMMQGHLIFGRGLGTFQWSFPAYERLDPDIPAKYAHNDYLQVMAELGAAGLILLLWAFVVSWRAALRNLRRPDSALVRGIGLASIGVLVAAALQEITDFSLYVPGTAVLLAVLTGLNFRAELLGRMNHERTSDGQPI